MKFEPKSSTFRSLTAILCAVLVAPGDNLAYGQQSSGQPNRSTNAQAAQLSPDQLDSLVAPIALNVDAQQEYALQPRRPYDVNQYSQRIVSNPGKQDGLAWQNPDGTWSGPIGENIARALEQGYTTSAEPYHGYFFKILKRQGPAAPLGRLDYILEGAMIGGFALVAAPAEYGVTGASTFIVS